MAVNEIIPVEKAISMTDLDKIGDYNYKLSIAIESYYCYKLKLLHK